MEKLIIKREFNFEIHPNNLGEMNWYETMKVIDELGDGWRLPTLTELQLIWNSEHRNTFERERYWTSSMAHDDYVCTINFYDGDDQVGTGKLNDNNVRLVRDLTI